MQLRKMGELPPKGRGNIKKKAGIAGALIYLSQGSAKSACDDGYEEVCSAAEQ